MTAQPDGTDRDNAQDKGSEVKLERERIYDPVPGELQLTVRAIITGCVIGGVVGAMNISLGLKIGWSFGGSIIAAILGFAIWATLAPLLGLRPFGVLETNITQTTGSAAGAMASAAGLLAPIPALAMLEGDHQLVLGYWELTFWALGVGFLGVFFAVPLRRQMVVMEKLRFPSGTATAETIVSIFAEGAEAVRRAKVLLIWSLIGAAVVLLKFNWAGFSFIESWPGGYVNNPFTLLTEPFSEQLDADTAPAIVAMIALLVTWGFHPIATPALTGAGLIIGPRVGISLLAGAIIGWGVLGPIVMANEWMPDQEVFGTTGVQGWILWPGVAIMVSDALMSLALSWKTIVNTFRRTPVGETRIEFEPPDQRIPNSVWLGGLGLGTICCMVVMQIVFGIPWWMTLLAVALSWVLAAIAVRSTGETDINPVGGMGKVTQLAFAGIAPGQIAANLTTAAISGAGASQAGDMMHDLKAGRMLGASPRRQLIAQCIGITAGILVVVPVYYLFSNVYHDTPNQIGEMTGDYPAPAAHAWKGVAEVLAGGIDDLPPHAGWAILAGLIFGAIVPCIRKFVPKASPYLPSGLAFGIAFIVPAGYPIMMFLGSMALILWKRLKPLQCKALVFAVASGCIAGEGVTNVFTALIELGIQFFEW